MLPMFNSNTRAALGLAFAAGTLLGVAGTGLAATTLGSDVFSDVGRGSFYDRAVGEMYSDGVIKGYEGTDRFGPDDFVTRGQVAVMLQRLRDDMEGRSDDDEDDDRSSRSSRSSSSRSSSASSAAMSNNPKGTFRFTTGTYTVTENKGTLTIAVVRVGGNQGAVTVDYTLNAGSASSGSDYEAQSGTLSFSNKETSKTFNVTIKNDTSSEGDEDFTVVLSNPTGGAGIGTSSATVTIDDDESGGSASSGSSRSSSSSSNPNGTIGFGAPTYIFMENAGNGTFTVQRTGGTNGTVSVNYATSNGTGQSGQEYTSVSGTLTFNSGESSKTFTIPLSDDSSTDGNKTFNVTLSSVTGGASMGTSSAAVSIFDNESGAEFGTGSLKFSKSDLDVTESSGKAEITIQRVGGALHAVSVNYSTVNGTAFSGLDYTQTSGTVTFAEGESSKIITIPLVKDSTNEQDDFFYVELSGATAGAPLITPYSTQILIED